MREGDVTLREIWKRTFLPHIEDYARQLIDIADRHLRRADLQLAVAGESDRSRPSTWRATIIAEERDLGSPLGFLVDVARECLESLLENDPAYAECRINGWETSNVVLLQRLALYGWTIRTDRTATSKVHWLLATGWLQNSYLRGEVTHLIVTTCPAAGEDAIALLVNEVREHWEDDEYAPRRAYALLTAIDRATAS